MNISGVGGYGTRVQSVSTPRKTDSAIQDAGGGNAFPKTDSVEISGGADCFQRLQSQFPQMTFSVGTGFAGKNARNTSDNANPYALTIHPKLLEKMGDNPKAEAEYTQRIRDIGRAMSLADGIAKAWGMKTVYCENYVNENGKFYHISVSVRKDELNEKLREEARENTQAFIERMRGSAREAAEKLEAKLTQATESGELTLDSDDMREMGAAAKSLEQNSLSVSETESEEAGSESVGGSVGINAAKLARKLAAAKTQSQIRAIMAEIQSDLRECESGKAQGMDVDEASVEAAERLLQEARQRMGQAENREPTPEEETASALASLF